MATEEREYTVESHGADLDVSRRPTQLTAVAACPFCGARAKLFLWSLAGSGKRCACGAMFWAGGRATRDVQPRFRRGQVIKEGAELGVVLQAGARTYDVVWVGGSTSRYRQGVRDVHLATEFELEGQDRVVRHLHREAQQARRERRDGAGIKRGQVWPSR